jgi:hypothetical protein
VSNAAAFVSIAFDFCSATPHDFPR